VVTTIKVMTSQTPAQTSDSGRWLALSIMVLVVLALATIAYSGTFSRIIYDDYCTASIGMEYGAWRGMVEWYNTWSGLYSNFFVKSAIAPLQPDIHRVLTGLFIVGWLGALWLFFGQLLTIWGFANDKWLRASLVLILGFTTINGAPTPENMFWFAVIIPYTFPMILVVLISTWCMYLVNHTERPKHPLLITIALSSMVFITVGSSETNATIMITALFLLMIYVAWFLRNKRSYLLPIFATAFIVSIIGLIIILLAPGNEIRQEAIIRNLEQENHPPIHIFAPNVLLGTLLFFIEPYGSLHTFLAYFASTVLFLWRLPHQPNVARLKQLEQKRLQWWTIGTLLVAFILIASVVAPLLYAILNVQLRSMFSARTIQLGMAMILGCITAIIFIRSNTLVRLRRKSIYKATRFALIFLFIALPAMTILRNVNDSFNYRIYAQSWDARHEQILQAKAQDEMDLVIPALDFYVEEV
jgi:MFS family permease